MSNRRSPFPDLQRPRIMAVINLTPDSFSDGGAFAEPEKALAQAIRVEREGADILDLGAESTRPGHRPIDAAVELARLLPALDAIRRQSDKPISIDTTKAEVAEAALSRGARIINDIWGLSGDPELAEVIGAHRAGVVLMHNSDVRDERLDIIAEMHRFFDAALARASRAGIADSQIVLDPGIGFGKTPRQNLIALKHAGRFGASFGLPVLIGCSRKSFIDRLYPSPVCERLGGTIAANLHALSQGVAIIRVHDVAAHVQALAVNRAIEDADA